MPLPISPIQPPIEKELIQLSSEMRLLVLKHPGIVDALARATSLVLGSWFLVLKELAFTQRRVGIASGARSRSDLACLVNSLVDENIS